MFKSKGEPRSWSPEPGAWSLRTLVLGVLGTITVGVAVLSIAVSYQILTPRFGVWAWPTVGALDALWVVLQATEILAANNVRRARRVQWAGLALTAVIAAIPTADLVLNRTSGDFDLAVIIAPFAIVATKTAWWLVLPSLGRKVSPATLKAIAARRQEVADRLEQMEADAAHRIELLRVAEALERQVGEAETDYRKATLKAEQRRTEQLHKQALDTAKAIEEKRLPDAVAYIALPELEGWAPTALALPVADRHALGTQVGALMGPQTGTSRGTAVTLADLAEVRGVPTPEPGAPLTDAQLGVVLRHLRYSEDPPRSYRQAVKLFRRSGFVGAEDRVRRVWSTEVLTESDETEEETEEETDLV
ncbi:hypothetical protein [Streptomyces flavofungini]|uniref:hypothetical protein n=1 Tax=Streptomyces flavofungini TaxID=68200 RepID=UPI0025B15A1F|nr:hypothetical protein [Streptomyces flavofungini]WJV51840.1 hypothetical protein QUY26_40745 [Streptomyces flavofungini]WJV51878.1 hypothetical protein QUY26_40600 [Streptomyces flavofungini]